MREEIHKAVGAHSLWKGRLRAVIDTGKCEFTVADVTADNKCEFGKWLYGVADGNAESRAHREAVRTLHANFHREVGKVLSAALDGHRDEAQKAILPGTPFANCSAKLTEEMIAWAKSAQ